LRRFVSQPPAVDQPGTNAGPVLGGASATVARLSQMNSPSKAADAAPQPSPNNRGSSPVAHSMKRQPVGTTSPDNETHSSRSTTAAGSELSSARRLLPATLRSEQEKPPSARLISPTSLRQRAGNAVGSSAWPTSANSLLPGMRSTDAASKPFPSAAELLGKGPSVPSASLRDAISPLVPRTRQAQPGQPVGQGDKASSKAAFDAALEHAVGVLEEQQRMRRDSDADEASSAGATSSQPAAASGKSLPDRLLQTKGVEIDLATCQAIAAEKAATAERCAGEAAAAREQAELHVVNAGAAAREAKRLAQEALDAIAASRTLLDSCRNGAADSRESVDEQLRSLLEETKKNGPPSRFATSAEIARSCGERSRQLAERSRERCSLVECA